MSKCPLRTLLVAKFISVLLFVVVGLAVSKCEPTQPSVVNSSSLEDSLREDSIASGITDTEAVNLMLRYNPELTYDEAEELLFRGMDEGVE